MASWHGAETGLMAHSGGGGALRNAHLGFITTKWLLSDLHLFLPYYSTRNIRDLEEHWQPIPGCTLLQRLRGRGCLT